LRAICSSMARSDGRRCRRCPRGGPQVNEEQHVVGVGHQSWKKSVAARRVGELGANEFRPGGRMFASGRGRHIVRAQNVADRLIGDMTSNATTGLALCSSPGIRSNRTSLARFASNRVTAISTLLPALVRVNTGRRGFTRAGIITCSTTLAIASPSRRPTALMSLRLRACWVQAKDHVVRIAANRRRKTALCVSRQKALGQSPRAFANCASILSTTSPLRKAELVDLSRLASQGTACLQF
jgi:hypothetical protein